MFGGAHPNSANSGVRPPSLLSTSEPHPDPGADDAHGPQQNQHVIHEPALRFRHRDASIVRILGSDGNEVFVVRKPGYGIKKKVTVPLQSVSALGSNAYRP